MDTKLRKDKCTKKTWILLLAVSLLPALILLSFYPRLGRAFTEDLHRMEAESSDKDRSVFDYYDPGPDYETQRCIPDEVIHDLLLNTCQVYANLNDLPDDAYGYDWDYLYNTVYKESYFYISCEQKICQNMGEGIDIPGLLSLPDTVTAPDKVPDEIRSLTGLDTVKAAIYICFDAYGKSESCRIFADPDVLVPSDPKNVLNDFFKWRLYQFDSDLLPKNTKAVYLLTDTSGKLAYTWTENLSETLDPEDAAIIYADNGAIFLILLLAGLVLLAGLILPAIRPLRTGWEKPFCLPFEIVFYGLGSLGFAGAASMYFLMAVTNPLTVQHLVSDGLASFLGFPLKETPLLAVLYILNFLGWALCFLTEYIFVVSLRQFPASPKRYLTQRVLVIRILNSGRRSVMKLIRTALDTDLDQEISSPLLKLLGVNLAVTAFLCLFHAAGIAGAVFYAALLYLFLRRYAGRIQAQYRSLIAACRRMAEGHIDIELKEEDLGIFRSLGTEINRIRDGFSKAVEKEASSQRMKTELISNVSHDLRTPLTAIITYVELLKDESLPPEKRHEYVRTLEHKTDRLKVLIDDLFEASKASSGDIRLNYAQVDPVRLLKEIRLEYEDSIAESGLDFRWNLPQERFLLTLDPARTCRIIENLLQNILKYSMPHSRVYIDLTGEKDRVCISFRNISAEEMNFNPEEITQRFVRGDLSRSTDGSGLGLAIARSFTELQGGLFDLQIDGDLFKVSLLFPLGPVSKDGTAERS